VLPRELVIEQSVVTDLSDEDLAAHIGALERLRARSADPIPDPAPADETKH
jgi:hypothetical protein